MAPVRPGNRVFDLNSHTRARRCRTSPAGTRHCFVHGHVLITRSHARTHTHAPEMDRGRGWRKRLHDTKPPHHRRAKWKIFHHVHVSQFAVPCHHLVTSSRTCLKLGLKHTHTYVYLCPCRLGQVSKGFDVTCVCVFIAPPQRPFRRWSEWPGGSRSPRPY